jgi:hypothetical protein
VFAPIVFDGASSGDVVAYNFIVNDNYESDFLRGSAFEHDVNAFELYEGNVATEVSNDGNHGTANMITRFRNLFTGWESCGNGQCGASPAKDSATDAIADAYADRYQNNVGNVLGTPGYTNAYLTDGQCFTTNVSFVSGCDNTFPSDPLVQATSLYWANWDTATNATRFCGNSSDTGWSSICANTSEVPTGATAYPNSVPTKGDTQAGQGAMPASFYLSSKPAWFGSLPWPPIGPDVTDGNVGQCAGTLNTQGQFAGVPALSDAQCTETSLTKPAWDGHANANPAMNCALNVMGMPPDGTGDVLSFDPGACY